MATFVATVVIVTILLKCTDLCAAYKSPEFKAVEWSTTLGLIKGRQIERNEKHIFQFRGVPFAEPPVGQLRFAKPKPMSKWNGSLNAMNFGPSCVQYLSQNDMPLIPTKNVSEDCLHLNLFVPNSLNSSAQRAVMVWIHGGGFQSGQSSMYDASDLALHGNVIVVTINYRLNIFGFFSSGDDNAGGNYGLWDQRQAIMWVKDNIKDYGGDDRRITIFGESAGGASVELLSLMPKNRNLFQRAISESRGGPMADGKQGSVLTSKAVSRSLNCSDTGAMVNCLRRVKKEDLLATYNKVTQRSGFSTLYDIGPRVDGDLIPGPEDDLLSNTESPSMDVFKNLDYLAGNNNGESGLLYFRLLSSQKQYNFDVHKGIPSRVICDLVAPVTVQENYDNCLPLSKAICAKYSNKSATLEDQTKLSASLFMDSFSLGTINALLSHAKNANPSRTTYHYLFSHEPNWHLIKERPDWLHGANHAGEEAFVFGLDAFYPHNETKTKEERDISKRVMDYWTSFAKTGRPGPAWLPYTADKREYLIIDTHDSMGSNLFGDGVTFWNDVVPGLVKSCSDGISGTTPKPHTGSNDINAAMLQKPKSILLFVNAFILYSIISLLSLK